MILEKIYCPEEQRERADKALRLNGFTGPDYPLLTRAKAKPTIRIKKLAKLKGASTNLSEHALVRGEPVYDVEQSRDGERGVIMSNPEGIGHDVLVSDANRGTTIKTTIRGDKNSTGMIELPMQWIGKKVYVRQLQVFSVPS